MNTLRIEHGFTPSGQQYVKQSIGRSGIIRTAKDAIFCSLVRLAIEEAKEEEARKYFIMKSISFWTFGDSDHVRGDFNLSHYEKVIEARAQYPHECVSCGDKFRVGAGHEIAGEKFCDVCLESHEEVNYLLSLPYLNNKERYVYQLINNKKPI